MMMNNTLRNQCNLLPGSKITGKWNKNTYTIIKELGQGANGIVYLVESNNKRAALKISDNGVSIISEMNILKAFSKVQGSALGPSLLEADDWVKNKSILSFYAMEYIIGDGFLEFIHRKGPSWTGVLILQLLTSLVSLHKQGWVFGDLKPENLIVTMPSCTIRCIDVGGTTLIGRSIKEFTEFFDRGYWGLGSRSAEPSYDLFAVAMIFINAYYPVRFSKNGDGYKQLVEMIKQKKELVPYRAFLQKALSGAYNSAEEMRSDLVEILQNQRKQPAAQTPSPQKAPVTRTRKHTKKRGRVQRRRGGLIETMLLVSIVCFLYVLYIYGQFL